MYLGGRSRQISEFEASLVFLESSRAAWNYVERDLSETNKKIHK